MTKIIRSGLFQLVALVMAMTGSDVESCASGILTIWASGRALLGEVHFEGKCKLNYFWYFEGMCKIKCFWYFECICKIKYFWYFRKCKVEFFGYFEGKCIKSIDIVGWYEWVVFVQSIQLQNCILSISEAEQGGAQLTPLCHNTSYSVWWPSLY